VSESAPQSDELPVKTADEILAIATATDLDQQWLEVPEWRTRVRLRELTRAEILHATKQAETKKGRVDQGLLNQHLFLMSIQEPRFTQEQYRRLCNRSGKPISKVMEAIKTLNGLGDEDDDDSRGAQEVAAAEAEFPSSADESDRV
jgi:hypothetical protein